MYNIQWWIVCVVGAVVVTWVDQRLEIKLPWWKQLIHCVCYVLFGGLLASI